MTDPVGYAWIDDDGLGEAVCIAALPGLTAEEVLAGLGVDPTDTVDPEGAYDGNCVGVISVPGGVVTVEPNGYQAAQHEVLARLAGGSGSAASMYWNVNALNAFTLVKDGEVVASVDMLHAESDDDTESMTELGLPPELHALWLQAAGDDASPWAVGIAMVEAITGIAIPASVEAPAAFYRVAEIVADDERRFDKPAPDDYPERTDGLAAMRSFQRRIDGLRAESSQLHGDATLEVSVEVAGTPAAAFKKAVWVHGWPTSNGASGASVIEVGNQVLHDATGPDARLGVAEHGAVYTRIIDLERPTRITWAWNWNIPDLDGYTRWESRRLLTTDSSVSLTLAKVGGRSEDARTRVDLRHTGVPSEWIHDLRHLWTWHLQQALTGKTYW